MARGIIDRIVKQIAWNQRFRNLAIDELQKATRKEEGGNMSDYIKRSDAIKAMGDYLERLEVSRRYAKSVLNHVPTIEPKRGEWLEWIDCEGEVFWKCSACGQVSEASAADILYKFCPFCGADMREREGEARDEH